MTAPSSQSLSTLLPGSNTQFKSKSCRTLSESYTESLGGRIGGQEYDVPGLDPPQHISRVINPSRNQRSSSRRVSKFRILKRTFHGIKYWSCADLLGLFLSSLGLAPNGATKRNFFLPLTAVYGRWCLQVRPTRLPVVFQCTWYERNSQATRFFLGASRSGFQVPLTTGTWKCVLSKARFSAVPFIFPVFPCFLFC